jgi:hypothetical protein
MRYHKEIKGLTQVQAINGLKAMLASDYFKAYVFTNAGLYSDLATVDLRGGHRRTEVQLKIGDITDVFANLLDVASKGTLAEAVVGLRPSEGMLKAMHFERRLYEEGLVPELPLTALIRREHKTENPDYSFSVFNIGLKQSFFDSQGLDYKDAQARVKQWYQEVTRQLKNVLHH